MTIIGILARKTDNYQTSESFLGGVWHPWIRRIFGTDSIAKYKKTDCIVQFYSKNKVKMTVQDLNLLFVFFYNETTEFIFDSKSGVPTYAVITKVDITIPEKEQQKFERVFPYNLSDDDKTYLQQLFNGIYKVPKDAPADIPRAIGEHIITGCMLLL